MQKLTNAFFKIAMVASFLILIVIAYIFMHAFFMSDLSKTPLENEIKEPVYLVSYADGPEVFLKNQKMLVYSGLQKGISYFFNYRRHFIDADFAARNKTLLSQKAGAGLWLWKPWAIMKTLKQVPENAYVVYCDSGFIVKGDMTPLLYLLKNHDMVLAAYSKEEGGTLGQLTVKETRIATGCDTPAAYEAPVIWAGLLIMKNTTITRRFIQQWLDYCQREELILPHTTFPNQRHQYDQSLLGITYFKNPQHIALVNAEQVGFNNILRWHHRNNATVEKDSLMLKLDNGIKGWERKIIDSAFFKKIADWIYALRENSSLADDTVKVLEAEGRTLLQ